jgi:uncharacterized protein YjiS (DUF1127 family)
MPVADRLFFQEAVMTTKGMASGGMVSGGVASGGTAAKSLSRQALPAHVSTARLALPIAVGAAVRVLFAIIATLVRGVRLLVRSVRNRRQTAELAHLDAHLLADIGLTPFDIRDAAAAPVWDDPTVLLRARALERRLNRHHVSLGFTPTP